jgi:hypothetical protein
MDMNDLKLKPLATYNKDYLNNHQVSMRSSMSYPTAVKYLRNEVEEPQLFFVIKLLHGLDIDWQNVTLGDLVEVAP